MITNNDKGKSIFTYTINPDGRECTNELKVTEDLQVKLKDLARSTYNFRFIECLGDISKDISTVYDRLRKYMKDISSKNLAFYNEKEEKVTIEDLLGEEKSLELQLDSLSTILNDKKNKGRFDRAQKELVRIKKFTNGLNPFERDIIWLLLELYEKGLMMPTLVYISSVKNMQLRWQTKEISLLVELNLGTKKIEGFLNFTKVDRVMELEPKSPRDLLYLIEQFELYVF